MSTSAAQLKPQTDTRDPSFYPQADAEAYVDFFGEVGLRRAIANIETDYRLMSFAGRKVPVSLNHTEYGNSYVCSPYTAYISYAKDELGLLNNRLLESLLAVLIRMAGGFLKAARINRTLSINNWLVSTNLIPDWDLAQLQADTESLSKAHPGHSLSIRSLNEAHHGDLMTELAHQGWLLIPARQVYLFDPESSQKWWKRSHTKKDQALLRKVEAGKTSLHRVFPEQLRREDFEQIHQCFHQLFIEKHSNYNPQFSTEYLYWLHKKGLVAFHGFRDDTGRIVASIGLFIQQNTITTPIVGYDTTLPKSLGLYRLLMAVLLKETYERGQPMNLSSGAGSFKRARGGAPTLEYTAFYCTHLPWHRRALLKGFSALMNRFAPSLFDKHQI